MEWRDIESAPKDARIIIGWTECATSGQGWLVSDVFWHRDHWCSEGDGIVSLTHWMPLPPPPAA